MSDLCIETVKKKGIKGEDSALRKVVQWCSALGIGLTIWICYVLLQSGVFRSQECFAEFVGGFGIFSGLAFVVLQVLQVVIPIFPGGISCLAGVLVFGEIKGFIYNYVGICIGSVILFYLARRYGRPLLGQLFEERKVRKYEAFLQKNNRFTKWFAIAIFLPVAPDDFLCALAGTTQMRARDFILIILLGKPFAIGAYSMGLKVLFDYLLRL